MSIKDKAICDIGRGKSSSITCNLLARGALKMLSGTPGQLGDRWFMDASHISDSILNGRPFQYFS